MRVSFEQAIAIVEPDGQGGYLCPLPHFENDAGLLLAEINGKLVLECTGKRAHSFSEVIHALMLRVATAERKTKAQPVRS